MGDQLLSTGQVAQILGCSRQHVVDLCERGVLPYRSTGAHRRISREDLETYRDDLQARPRREDLRSLWLNRAIVGKLASDPERVLAIARRNLERFRAIHAGGSAIHWLDEWQRVIDAGPESVMRILAADTRHARDLRQNSPFAGVLSEDERQGVLSAFRRTWMSSAA